MSSQENDSYPECPLCMEPLDIDDLGFFPCSCGYQICRFCWHRLRNDENGLCPACRQVYPENPAGFNSSLSIEEIEELKKKAKRGKNKDKQKKDVKSQNLASLRVVQKNLLFVIGLPSRLTPDDLKKEFSRFGKIIKLVVNNSTCYVTYARVEDAIRAIQALNSMGTSFGSNVGKDSQNRSGTTDQSQRSTTPTLRASLGTTKYCNHFLRSQPCPKIPECMYLHDYADPEASFTKEEMQQGKHTEYEKKLISQHLSKMKNPTPAVKLQTSAVATPKPQPPSNDHQPRPWNKGSLENNVQIEIKDRPSSRNSPDGQDSSGTRQQNARQSDISGVYDESSRESSSSASSSGSCSSMPNSNQENDISANVSSNSNQVEKPTNTDSDLWDKESDPLKSANHQSMIKDLIALTSSVGVNDNGDSIHFNEDEVNQRLNLNNDPDGRLAADLSYMLSQAGVSVTTKTSNNKIPSLMINNAVNRDASKHMQNGSAPGFIGSNVSDEATSRWIDGLLDSQTRSSSYSEQINGVSSGDKDDDDGLDFDPISISTNELQILLNDSESHQDSRTQTSTTSSQHNSSAGSDMPKMMNHEDILHLRKLSSYSQSQDHSLTNGMGGGMGTSLGGHNLLNGSSSFSAAQSHMMKLGSNNVSWQNSLRSLLPNVNITFNSHSPQQQQPQQTTQNAIMSSLSNNQPTINQYLLSGQSNSFRSLDGGSNMVSGNANAFPSLQTRQNQMTSHGSAVSDWIQYQQHQQAKLPGNSISLSSLMANPQSSSSMPFNGMVSDMNPKIANGFGQGSNGLIVEQQHQEQSQSQFASFFPSSHQQQLRMNGQLPAAGQMAGMGFGLGGGMAGQSLLGGLGSAGPVGGEQMSVPRPPPGFGGYSASQVRF